jgi:hypothetical protein
LRLLRNLRPELETKSIAHRDFRYTGQKIRAGGPQITTTQ